MQTRFGKELSFSCAVSDKIVAAVSHPYFKLRWLPEDKKDQCRNFLLMQWKDWMMALQCWRIQLLASLKRAQMTSLTLEKYLQLMLRSTRRGRQGMCKLLCGSGHRSHHAVEVSKGQKCLREIQHDITMHHQPQWNVYSVLQVRSKFRVA